MGSMYLDVHPVYGAIYKDGEFVQRGAVLGLSVDAKAVVVAPVSGWVKVSDKMEIKQGIETLQIEIRPQLHQQ